MDAAELRAIVKQLWHKSSDNLLARRQLTRPASAHLPAPRRGGAACARVLTVALCWAARGGGDATGHMRPAPPRAPGGARRWVLRLRGAGLVHQQTLDYSAFLAAWPNASIYSCAACGAHVSTTSYVLSKKFQVPAPSAGVCARARARVGDEGRAAAAAAGLPTGLTAAARQGKSGRAYMMRKVVNCYLGPREDRVLIAGLHTVADVHCRGCQSLLGWKYLEVFDNNQRLKVGRYVLEKTRIVKVGGKHKGAGEGGVEKDADAVSEAAGRRDWAAGYGVASGAGERGQFVREAWGRDQGAGEGYGSGLSGDVGGREGSPYRMQDDAEPGRGDRLEGAWVTLPGLGDALQGAVVVTPVAGSRMLGGAGGLPDEGHESRGFDERQARGSRYSD